jgi:predicted RNA methylase
MCFFDLGSGIGSVVLQASYAAGRHSIGIEILKARHAYAVQLKTHAIIRAASVVPRELEPGKVQCVCEDVTSKNCAGLFEI